MRTLVIGRSPSADVVIADASLAPHHAELVITDDGRLYLTDCATDAGTWIQSEGQSTSGWQPTRQGFVHADQPLRLGDYQCTAGDLLRRSRGAPAEDTPGGGASGGAGAGVACAVPWRVIRPPARSCGGDPEPCCTFRRCAKPGFPERGTAYGGPAPQLDPEANAA